MNIERINKAVEDAIVREILSGNIFKINYEDKIDLKFLNELALKSIDQDKILERVKEGINEKIAEKIVSKVHTELGNDIKRIMRNAEIREDFRSLLRKQTEELLDKVKREEIDND